MRKGVKMEQNKTLENMLCTFIECAENSNNDTLISKNYEMQKIRYQALFESGEENLLVCARCILSATRALLYSDSSSDESLKEEIRFLRPLVLERKNRAQIKKTIIRRIETLKTENSDNISDALLFMYIALANNVVKEKSLERNLL